MWNAGVIFLSRFNLLNLYLKGLYAMTVYIKNSLADLQIWFWCAMATNVQLGKISSDDTLTDELILWYVYWISSQFLSLQILVVRAYFARVWMRVTNFFQSCSQELLERNGFLSNSQTHLHERSPTNLWFCVPELNFKTVNSRFGKGYIHERKLFCCDRVHINLLFAPL